MSTVCSVLTADRFFSLFYVAAFAAALALLYIEGRRRTWPTSSWLVLVAAGITFGIIGSRLGAISLADWSTALGHGSLPTTTGKTFVGLILLGIAGIFLVQRFLRFRSTTGDAFALALPVGMAVMRLGCLFGGCCFGTPTNLPWAITYQSGSLAATVHQMRGLILPGASALPVHPVQLYEIGLLVIVVVALLRMREVLRQPGSLCLLYLVLHAWSRFLVEFVREGTAGPALLGLRPLQAGLLVFCAGCAAFLVVREKAPFIPQPTPVPSAGRNLAALGSVALFLFVSRNWFTPAEQFVLAGASLPALVSVTFQLVRSAHRAWSRWAALAAAGAAAILLGAGSDTLPPPRVGHLSYYDVSLSGGAGSYHEFCGGTYKYNQFGAGIARTDRWGRYTRLKYGVQGYRYNESTTYGSYRSPASYGVRALVGGEFRWAGLEAGALFDGFGDEPNGILVLPSARVRLGPSDIVYLEAAYLAHENSHRPWAKLGIGTSHWDWGSIHLGLCDQGFYLEPDIRTNSGLSFSPFIAFASSDVWQLSLRLQYNFKDFTLAPIGLKEY
jgi:phosphatidylglycerol:prolipoprotein diacylglycerol transferase